MDQLNLNPRLGLRTISCGLFISSGKGTHPDRILDSFELIVVRKGTLAIWEDDVLFEVPSGHALLLLPGRRHRGAAPFGKTLSFYWVHFVLSANRNCKSGLRLPQFGQVQRPECVAELFHRYLDDQEAQRLDPLYSGLLVLQILCEVARKPIDAEAFRGSVLAGRTDAYVTHHLAEKLSTGRVAHALRINPDYLNRVFREVHQMTLTEYIHRRKLKDAASLLRETTNTVAEVAVACGYATPGYFGRVFERYHGVTPGAYRRLMARAHVNAR